MIFMILSQRFRRYLVDRQICIAALRLKVGGEQVAYFRNFIVANATAELCTDIINNEKSPLLKVQVNSILL